MVSHPLLLSYYGDDFTGSTDALEALTQAGVETVLFLKTPDPAALARFPGVRCVGLAGHARGRSPAWMQEHLQPALAALAALGAPLLQYKVCSTFDSSPQIGSIGCAIDLGVPLMRGGWSPMVVGVPQLRRFQAFGNLFAVVDGEGHRLDRHPTMSRHPVTPMHEADLRKHLAQQTGRPMALVDFTRLKAGSASVPGVADASGEVPVVLIDVLDEDSQRAAGALVWENRGEGLFSASSSGLQYALTAHWRACGLLPALSQPLPGATAVRQIAAISGSCSPVTGRQIDRAGQQGFSLVRLDLGRALTDDGTEVSNAVVAAAAVLASGGSPLVYSARGPDDPAVRGFDDAARQAGLDRRAAAHRTGLALADIARRLLDGHPALRRIAVAGGDSSGEVAAALDIDALTVVAGLAPGAPLCRAWSHDPRRDGIELVLKGGQLGDEGFFAQVRDGRPAALSPALLPVR